MSEILQFALPVQSNVDSLWIDRRSVPTPHRDRSVPSLCRDSRSVPTPHRERSVPSLCRDSRSVPTLCRDNSVPTPETEDRAGIEVGNGKVSLVDSSGLRHVQTSSPPL